MYIAHIASRTLPAAGAWYTSATAHDIRGSWQANAGDVARLSVMVTYTAGGAGGYPKLRYVWTALSAADGSTTKTARDTMNSGTTSTSGAEITISNYQTVHALQSLLNGSAERVELVLEVPPGKTHLKVECAEVGATGTPGTIVVDIDGEV